MLEVSYPSHRCRMRVARAPCVCHTHAMFVSHQMTLILVSALVTVVAVTPVLAVLLIPVGAIYFWLQNFYRCTSRELQRLNNITKSPIFAHLSETLGGITTIRYV